MLVCVQDVPVLIQVPSNGLEKALEKAPESVPLPPCGNPSACLLHSSESEPVEELCLFVTLSSAILPLKLISKSKKNNNNKEKKLHDPGLLTTDFSGSFWESASVFGSCFAVL